MMHRLIKIFTYIGLGVLALFLALVLYLYAVARVEPPQVPAVYMEGVERKALGEDFYVLGNNWLKRGESGWWELYVEGEPYERGISIGRLSRELVYYQEKVFYEQICKLVPSSFYRRFLKYFIAFFNKDLVGHLTEEQKLEIYGISLSASDEFDEIGPAYQRFMNYHAAHDIGHALQNLALVGCTSFATWENRSEDGNLIVGRNFDFYAGDGFAENKIAAFYKPSEGYKFMMVGWGGMTGVVSGMNIEGLTVTINAAKSDMPAGSATPVSILAREILQYAANIEDAVKIASKRKTFVSESFLIASANDNKAVVIEKTPGKTEVYASGNEYITCTNHYQSEAFMDDPSNRQQLKESASLYRMQRLEELLAQVPKNTVNQTVSILRDQAGLQGKFLGHGNEKAINQLIAHHSVVFEPHNKKVWLSTTPWQLGKFVCYDLNKVFALQLPDLNEEIADTVFIGPDDFLNSNGFQNFLQFRKLKAMAAGSMEMEPESFVENNPGYYHAYVLAGDAYFRMGKWGQAEGQYRKALLKEVATKSEEDYITGRIAECQIKSRKK